MADQTIGTARIGVEIDTTQVESGTNRAKVAIKSLGVEAENASTVATAAYTREDKALMRRIQTLGLDQEARLRLSIQNRASAKNAEELVKALDAHVAGLRESRAAMAEAAAAEASAARPKLEIIRYNGQLNESERSLNERRALGNKVLNDTAKATVNWGEEQKRANQRVKDMEAAEARRAQSQQKTAQMTAKETQELQKLLGQIDPTVAGLNRLAEAEKKLERLGGQAGMSPAIMAQYQTQIEATRQRLLSARQEADVTNSSLGRLNLNSLSAQQNMVNLGRSIATGQWGMAQGNITTLVTSTGALGPAALASTAGVTALAAAVAGVIVLAYQGSTETYELNRALIASGNSAGVTAARLGDTAKEMANLGNITRGSAVEALTAAASTGAFTAEQMELAATAALQWKTATGDAIDTTIAKFVRLADDPVAAILELNKQMGFLTEEQLRVISNLVDQGKHTEAATEAIRLFADTLGTRSAEMVENTGLVEKAWKAVKNAVAEAADAIKSIGRQGSLKEQLAQIDGLIASMERTKGAGLQTPAALKSWQNTMDGLVAQRDKLLASVPTDVGAPGTTENRRALEANFRFSQQTTAEFGKQLDLQGRINKMRDDARKAGVTDEKLIAEREKALREADGRQQARKQANAGDGGIGAARMAAIRAEGAAEAARLAGATSELQAQYKAREVSANDYYARLRDLAEQSTAAETATIQKQIAALQDQGNKRKSSAAVAQQVAALESQLGKAREAGESRLRQLTTEEQNAAKVRAEGLRSYREALQAQTQSLRDQMDTMVARERMGSREFEVQSKLNEVYADQARRLREIADAQGTGKMSVEDANQRRDALREEIRDRVAVVRQGYAEADAARLDWQNGLERGFSEFASSSMDISGQIARSLNSAFDGAADAIVNFAQTGKLSFSDLARSIMADLTRIAVKIAITKSLESMFGGGGYSGGSGGGIATSASTAGSNRKGFASGGYTGPGGVNDVRGDVHAGEVVFSQADVARNGGVAAVERMRLGSTGTMSAGAGGGAGGVVVNLIGLDKAPQETRESQLNGQMQIDLIFEQIDAKAAEGVANGTSRLSMALGRGG